MTAQHTAPGSDSSPETSLRDSRANEARYRALVRATAAIVWTADATGAFQTEQAEWAAFTGQTLEQYRGWGWADAIHPNDRARALAAWRSAVDNGSATELEYRLRGADGVYRWFAVLAVPVLDAGGEGVVSEWIGMNRDITEYKTAERQHDDLLREAQAARSEAEAAKRVAESASRARSEFLATMSHEFRTPLNGILGYTQLLELELAGPLTPQQRQYLARLTGSTGHLLTLVSDVLDVAKVDAGQLSIVHEHEMTGAAVAAAIGMIRPHAEAKGITVVDLGKGTAGVPYVGDEDRVRQIVANLLSNAVKFTAAGGTVTIGCEAVHELPPEVQVEGRGTWASVRVTDTGVGIAPEQQSRIFEAFHQIDGGRTRAAGGTGLGLTISRRLAKLMGGDLTVKSELGHGSAFTLWLPASRRTDAGEVEAVRAHEDPAGARAILRVQGLRDVGEALRDEIHHILDAYNDRLRAEPSLPEAHVMRRPELEDHAMSLLADFAQSLVMLEGAGDEAASILRDGSAIQRIVAERHGLRRYAQGWRQEALERDQEIMRDEIQRAVRARLRSSGTDVADALGVLTRLIDKSGEISLAAWRQAAQRVQS